MLLWSGVYRLCRRLLLPRRARLPRRAATRAPGLRGSCSFPSPLAAERARDGGPAPHLAPPQTPRLPERPRRPRLAPLLHPPHARAPSPPHPQPQPRAPWPPHGGHRRRSGGLVVVVHREDPDDERQRDETWSRGGGGPRWRGDGRGTGAACRTAGPRRWGALRCPWRRVSMRHWEHASLLSLWPESAAPETLRPKLTRRDPLPSWSFFNFLAKLVFLSEHRVCAPFRVCVSQAVLVSVSAPSICPQLGHHQDVAPLLLLAAYCCYCCCLQFWLSLKTGVVSVCVLVCACIEPCLLAALLCLQQWQLQHRKIRVS